MPREGLMPSGRVRRKGKGDELPCVKSGKKIKWRLVENRPLVARGGGEGGKTGEGGRKVQASGCKANASRDAIAFSKSKRKKNAGKTPREHGGLGRAGREPASPPANGAAAHRLRRPRWGTCTDAHTPGDLGTDPRAFDRVLLRPRPAQPPGAASPWPEKRRFRGSRSAPRPPRSPPRPPLLGTRFVHSAAPASPASLGRAWVPSGRRAPRSQDQRLLLRTLDVKRHENFPRGSCRNVKNRKKK